MPTRTPEQVAYIQKLKSSTRDLALGGLAIGDTRALKPIEEGLGDVARHYGLTKLGKALGVGAGTLVAGELLHKATEGGSNMAEWDDEHGLVIRKWTANGAQFVRFQDGTQAVKKKDGLVKYYKPYKPVVFGKALKVSAFIRLAQKYEKTHKELDAIFKKIKIRRKK